jgi:AcrR family transcriptional regulator
MPLQTFLNLSKTRKDKILKVSYEEFAFNSYRTASVSNIVKRLEIAKGSFYRYFESKIDLYSHLTKNAYYLRMLQVGVLLENESYDFFEILRENFRNKIIFDLTHPIESIFLYNLFHESGTEEVRKLYSNLTKEALTLTKDLIVQFQNKGDLNPGINPEITAQFIYQTQLGIYEYLSFFKGVDFKEGIKNGSHFFNIAEEELMEVVDGFLQIIKSGLEIK